MRRVTQSKSEEADYVHLITWHVSNPDYLNISTAKHKPGHWLRRKLLHLLSLKNSVYV